MIWLWKQFECKTEDTVPDTNGKGWFSVETDEFACLFGAVPMSMIQYQIHDQSVPPLKDGEMFYPLVDKVEFLALSGKMDERGFG